jgi:DNA-binding NtrC family response regulator
MSVVLIAENDPDALDLALTDLRLEGHQVHAARNAAEAESMLAEVAPDVVVLDHRMPPGETGLALAERLVVQHPGLRVVMYSNYQSPELSARAQAIGVRFLAKGNLRALRSALVDS